MHARVLLVASAVALGACGAADRGTRGALADDAGDVAVADLALAQDDFGPPPFMGVVYAHSADTLYSIDPATLAVTKIGPFQFKGGLMDQITDIALDKDSNMVGVSFDSLYTIDRTTAVCKRRAGIGQSFNALSYIPVDQIDPGMSNAEILVGADLAGDVWSIDPASGATKKIGNYGGGLASSGDIVAVTGYGTVATVKQAGHTTDYLARLDMTHGARATILGDTGRADFYGLGFWNDKVFGFSDQQFMATIDPKNGATRSATNGSIAWWGAGVTTAAPVTIQ